MTLLFEGVSFSKHLYCVQIKLGLGCFVCLFVSLDYVATFILIDLRMQQNYLCNKLLILGALNGLGYLALRLASLPPFNTKFLLSETGWLHIFFLDLALACDKFCTVQRTESF